MKEPMFGDQCSKYVPTVDTTMPFMLASHIRITDYYWAVFDPYTHWPEEVTAFTDPEAVYSIVIEFTMDTGYKFSSAGTVTVNGKETEGITQYGTTTRTTYDATLHYTFGGRFTSYLDSNQPTFISLLQDGEKKYSTSGYGNNEISFSIPSVAGGEYTMRVTKTNHVPREYAVTVSGNTTQNAEICPIGDVSGDGKVTTKDYAMANAHAQKVSLLEGYALKCGDVLKGDGKITTADAARINAAAQKVDPLW